MKRKIWCCGCHSEVSARLTDGVEIYPHRTDLASLPFWRCDTCRNFVGCHHKTRDRTKPLGVIPTSALRSARSRVHQVIDPLWKSGRVERGKLYRFLANRLGIDEYHTAELRSVEDAEKVIEIVQELKP